VVKLIRKRYSKDLPIIICADSGFAVSVLLTHLSRNHSLDYVCLMQIKMSCHEKKQTRDVSLSKAVA